MPGDRLRFAFVLVSCVIVCAVHAGEAKLRGCMTIVVLIAGPPGCEFPCFACGFSPRFCCYLHWFEDAFSVLAKTSQSPHLPLSPKPPHQPQAGLKGMQFGRAPTSGSPTPKRPWFPQPQISFAGSKQKFPSNSSQAEASMYAKMPKPQFPNESPQTKVPKRKLPSESCQERVPSERSEVKIPKRKFRSSSLQTKTLKRKFQRQGSHEKTLKQMIPKKSVQAKDPKSKLPNERAQAQVLK